MRLSMRHLLLEKKFVSKAHQAIYQQFGIYITKKWWYTILKYKPKAKIDVSLEGPYNEIFSFIGEEGKTFFVKLIQYLFDISNKHNQLKSIRKLIIFFFNVPRMEWGSASIRNNGSAIIAINFGNFVRLRKVPFVTSEIVGDYKHRTIGRSQRRKQHRDNKENYEWYGKWANNVQGKDPDPEDKPLERLKQDPFRILVFIVFHEIGHIIQRLHNTKSSRRKHIKKLSGYGREKIDAMKRYDAQPVERGANRDARYRMKDMLGGNVFLK